MKYIERANNMAFSVLNMILMMFLITWIFYSPSVLYSLPLTHSLHLSCAHYSQLCEESTPSTGILCFLANKLYLSRPDLWRCANLILNRHLQLFRVTISIQSLFYNLSSVTHHFCAPGVSFFVALPFSIRHNFFLLRFSIIRITAELWMEILTFLI